MNGDTFNYPANTVIPIGAPDLSVNANGLYQGGGKELEFGEGGVCTACHAGENPFIIHPEANLGGGISMGELADKLPTFAGDRYQPLVPGTWPQNRASEADENVPSKCRGCHTKGGIGGRFPELSAPLAGYCDTILREAINRTMPPGTPPGSLKDDPEVVAFVDRCNPTTSPSVSLTPQSIP